MSIKIVRKMESSLVLNTGMGMSMAHARGETAVAGHGGDQNIRIFVIINISGATQLVGITGPAET